MIKSSVYSVAYISCVVDEEYTQEGRALEGHACGKGRKKRYDSNEIAATRFAGNSH